MLQHRTKEVVAKDTRQCWVWILGVVKTAKNP